MKKKIVLFVYFVNLIALPAWSQQDGGIDKFRTEWVESFQAKQLDRLMSLYDEQASVLLSTGEIIKGSENIKNYYQNLFSSAVTLKINLHSSTSEASGEVGYDVGQYEEIIGKAGVVLSGKVVVSGKATIQGGGSQEDHNGGYLVVLKRSKESWLIIQQAATERHSQPGHS